MNKSFFVLALLLVFGLVATEASALGWRRAARARAATSYHTYGSYGATVVDQLPSSGATKVQYGWVYEFRYTGSHSGTWYPMYPVGANANDYYYGEPRDGATKYEDGLNWTYDSRRGKWVSEWYPVR